MTNLWQDIRYGVRLLTRDGSFTLAAVLTLALGIGANTAIFSVINGILLNPLPYQSPDRLVFLTEWSEQVPEMSFSVENFKDLRDQSTLFESFVAYNSSNLVLTGDGEAERVSVRNVTSGVFQTLGIQPILGRAFTPEEDKDGADRVVLLGQGYWTRRFGASPDIVGQQITLNDQSYTVLGVLPDRMHGSWRRSDLFTPLLRRESEIGGPDRRGSHPGIYVVGRLKPGVTVEQGRAEAVSIAHGLAGKYRSNTGQSMTLVSLTDAVVGDLRPALMVLLAAVAFVLLIACANVANLLLGRAASRQRELAVRTALGASRARVIRQLLTESVLLSIVGGGLGLVLAYWGVAGLLAWIPSSVPRVDEIRVDGTVLLFTAAVTLFTGLLFGLAPAFRASRTEANSVLKSGGRSATSAGHQRLRAALVVAEVSLAIILLVGAGLMIRSFYQVLHADSGIRPEGVLATQISLPKARYDSPERLVQFTEQAVLSLRALPGVEYAASTLPLLGGWQNSFAIEGRPEPEAGQWPSTDITRVSSDYFKTMGIEILKGRGLTDDDKHDAPKVCVVDETFVRTYWPNEDPIGKKIRFGSHKEKDAVVLEVVGVVRHVKNYGVDQPSRVETYVSYQQDPVPSFSLVLRTRSDPGRLADAVRKAVGAIDPAVPVFATQTLESQVEESRASRRLSMVLLSVFAGLALLLSAVGIYGVISYSVTQRTQEIGIRMALGAERSQILRMVMRQGATLSLAGVVLGLAASLGLARLITTMLFQVGATDPPTFSVVPVLLMVVATVAAYLPALRATRVEPMTALRDE